MRSRRHSPRDRGFSFTELLISMVLLALISAGVWRFVTAQSTTMSRTIGKTKIQSGLDHAKMQLALQLPKVRRLATNHSIVGYGIVPIPGKSYNSSSGEMDVSDSNADAIRLVVTENPKASTAHLTSNMASPSDSMTFDNIAGVTFESLWTIFGNTAVAGLVPADFFQVTGVVGNVVSHGASAFNPSGTFSQKYNSPSFLYPVSVFEYGIDRSDAANPRLVMRRDGGAFMGVANGVTKFQIFYSVHDGTYDPNVGGATLITLACGKTLCQDPGSGDATRLSRLYDVVIQGTGTAKNVKGESTELFGGYRLVLTNFSYRSVTESI